MKLIVKFDENSGRVYCGGSWYYSMQLARVALRFGRPPGDRDRRLGFRLFGGIR